MNEITQKIDKDKSTVTALIKKLEKLELIEKFKNENDSRSTIIKLTEKGLATKTIFEQISKKLIETTYKDFLEKDKSLVYELLTRIEKNFI